MAKKKAKTKKPGKLKSVYKPPKRRRCRNVTKEMREASRKRNANVVFGIAIGILIGHLVSNPPKHDYISLAIKGFAEGIKEEWPADLKKKLEAAGMSSMPGAAGDL